MKNISKIAVAALIAISFAFASCGETKPTETTGNTNTEDLVDGADGGIDSLVTTTDSTNTATAPAE